MSKKHFVKGLSDTLELPKDVLCGAVMIKGIGNREFYISNFKGILVCTEKEINIRTKQGNLKISGRKLLIEYFTEDEIKVCGEVRCIEFIM